MWSRSEEGDSRFRDEDDQSRETDLSSESDGRSQSRTWFNAEEDYKGDKLDDPEKWRRLSQVNNGQLHESKYVERRRDAETLRDLDIVASRFEITEYQKNRCEHIIESLDDIGETWPWDRIVVVFALVTLVVNEDYRHIQNEDMYNDLIEDMEVSRSSIHKIRDELRDHL